MHGLLLPTLLLCSSLLATAANDDNSLIRTFCPSDANYTRGSAFQANLNALLSSLPATAAAAPTAYATNTTGTSPNKAYGLAQCRVDFVNTPDCGACLDGSVQGLAASNCAGQKKATIVYDNCLLRLSGESFAGAMDMSGPFILVNGQNATQPELFEPQLGSLMSNLTRKAAYESPRMMSAVGSATVTPFETIYGMTQCTRDLGAEDCNRCLQNAVSLLPNYCSKLKGCRVIYPSCAVQFEVYRFYNLQAAEAAMAPAAAPGGGLVNGSDHSGPGSNGSNHAVRTALLMSIPVAVALLVLVLVVVYLCRRYRKPHKHVQIASTRDRMGGKCGRRGEAVAGDAPRVQRKCAGASSRAA